MAMSALWHAGQGAAAKKLPVCIQQAPSHNLADLRVPCRSLANGMVIGTSEGFTKELTLIGVGYRGAVSGQKLTMNLGYSHPVEMDIPQGITVQVHLVQHEVQAPGAA